MGNCCWKNYAELGFDSCRFLLLFSGFWTLKIGDTAGICLFFCADISSTSGDGNTQLYHLCRCRRLEAGHEKHLTHLSQASANSLLLATNFNQFQFASTNLRVWTQQPPSKGCGRLECEGSRTQPQLAIPLLSKTSSMGQSQAQALLETAPV